VFGRRVAGHSHHSEHPLRRRVLLTILGAALLAALFLLIAPRNANGNFVYWTTQPDSSIGRAKINGAGLNNGFIPGLNAPTGVAVDSKFVYWAEQDGNSIGRANLDGSGVNRNFIPSTAGVSQPTGVAVTSTAIFWANDGTDTIGRANLDGTGVTPDFIALPVPSANCGIAADSNFVYWTDTLNPSDTVGRAPVGGGAAQPDFIAGISAECGVAVDNSSIYWGTESPDSSIGRASLGGTGATNNFIPGAVSSDIPCGVAVNSQYVFWGNLAAGAIGRANINGGSPNPALATGANGVCLLAAAPSNKITVDSVKKKKKKGTATIDARVPGPGQVTLNQTSAPSDVNAVAAGVKQVGLTVTQASSFKLAVKPTGKTAKKLNKQVKKQLRKKRKAKAKASVTVFIHFLPAGVAGVPNTERLKVTLIKQRRKKK
jgi:virginiamycin B lyase